MDSPLAFALPGLTATCLIVEDDPVIRLDLEETLKGFGLHAVLGAATLEAAAEISTAVAIRVAVLDYEIGTDTTAALAELLLEGGAAVLFLSAHGAGVELPRPLRHVQVLAKPFSSALLAEALLRAMGKGIPCGSLAS